MSSQRIEISNRMLDINVIHLLKNTCNTQTPTTYTLNQSSSLLYIKSFLITNLHLQSVYIFQQTTPINVKLSILNRNVICRGEEFNVPCVSIVIDFVYLTCIYV